MCPVFAVVLWAVLLCNCESTNNTSSLSLGRQQSRILAVAINNALRPPPLGTYDKKFRPNDGADPVNVLVEFKVVSLGEIKEAKMEYEMDIFFRQWWYDPRFKHSVDRVFTMAGDATKLFWTPDTYFVNAKVTKYHFVTRENMRIMIWPDGKIYFSTRITLAAQCEMDFHLYPMDTQRCSLVIESYAHTVEDIIYAWKGGKSKGIEVVSKATAQFEVVNVTRVTTAQTNSKGSFSSLKANFFFKRRSKYFFNQNFLPTIFLVIISWCDFWISPEAVPARVSLSVTTVLSILFLSSTINANMPKVSYMKAIDYFLSISFIFIFATLIEYVVVLNTRGSSAKTRLLKKSSKRSPEEKERMDVLIKIMDDQNGTDDSVHKKLVSSRSSTSHLDSVKHTIQASLAMGSNHRVDRWCRVLFPLFYALFLFGYWLYYTYLV